MTRIQQHRHPHLTLYITQHNEGVGDVYRSERRDGEQIARGSLDRVMAETQDWLKQRGHICPEQCSGWEEVVKQWVFSYPDGKVGHIVTRDDGPYLLVVHPLHAPGSGSLPVDAAETLDAAISAANRIAGQESARADWRGPAN